jgi:hypothetical protein
MVTRKHLSAANLRTEEISHLVATSQRSSWTHQGTGTPKRHSTTHGHTHADTYICEVPAADTCSISHVPLKWECRRRTQLPFWFPASWSEDMESWMLARSPCTIRLQNYGPARPCHQKDQLRCALAAIPFHIIS